MAQHKVMFVCLGNICRSPMAEGMFRHLVEQAGRLHEFEIASSGTAGWHVGNPPDARGIETIAARGVDTSAQRCQQLSLNDLTTYDHIIVMDQSNLDDVRALARSVDETQSTGKVALMMSFAQDSSVREVPDPWSGTTADYEYALDLITTASEGLLDHLS